MKHLIPILAILIFAACNQSTKKQELTNLTTVTESKQNAPPTASSSNEGFVSNDKNEEKVTIVNSNPVGCVATCNFNVTNEYDASKVTSDLQSSNAKTNSIYKQKLIRNASLTIQVEDYIKAKKAIHDLIKKSNGYISSEQESKAEDGMTSTVTIKCTPEIFENLINNVIGVAAFVENKTIKADDVTADFYDLQSRIKTKKEEELQYISILHRSGKISDILEVENQLRIIREEIEAAEGKMRLMNDQVNYSTIDLVFYEKGKAIIAPENGFGSKLVRGFASGWSFLLNLLIGIVTIWPLCLILLVVSYFIKRKFFSNKP